METKACSKCEYWKRNGTTGICFGGTPKPQIVESGKDYTLVWPSTNPDEYCPTFSERKEEIDFN